MEAQVKTEKKETKKVNNNYLKDKHKEKVKGIFRFYEVPGGCMSFVFKEFKGEPVERYDLMDGAVYTLPLGVAKHLNKNGWYPEYSYIKGEAIKDVTNTMKVTKKVRRFGFQSLEFVDIDDLGIPEQVVSVENILTV